MRKTDAPQPWANNKVRWNRRAGFWKFNPSVARLQGVFAIAYLYHNKTSEPESMGKCKTIPPEFAELMLAGGIWATQQDWREVCLKFISTYLQHRRKEVFGKTEWLKWEDRIIKYVEDGGGTLKERRAIKEKAQEVLRMCQHNNAERLAAKAVLSLVSDDIQDAVIYSPLYLRLAVAYRVSATMEGTVAHHAREQHLQAMLISQIVAAVDDPPIPDLDKHLRPLPVRKDVIDQYKRRRDYVIGYFVNSHQ